MTLKNKIDSKLTEDQTIQILMEYLIQTGWDIKSYCLGQQRGYDIIAFKDGHQMFIEAKGAKASDDSPTKKRKFFDTGQIKDHFGKAIVKSLETMNTYPNAIIAIAHPDDEDIRRSIGSVVKYINKLGIVHYWIGSNNDVHKEK